MTDVRDKRMLEAVMRLARWYIRDGVDHDNAWRLAYVEHGATLPGVYIIHKEQQEMHTTRRERAHNLPFCAQWFVHAPWAHTTWQSYLLSLADLTTTRFVGLNNEPSVLYKPGVTHELIVWAVDPRKHVITGPYMEKWDFHRALLQPANHVYQFAAESDDIAWARVNAIAHSIEAARLSPDTDYRKAWDIVFQDGVSLYALVMAKKQ